MTMYNTLPAGHKLYPLLEPQSQSLIDFDFTLMTHLWGQISPPTPVSGYMGLLKLLDRFAAENDGRSFFDDDPMAELAKRRLESKDFTKVTAWDAYPVVGDLLDLWEITGDYVSAVVHDLYETRRRREARRRSARLDPRSRSRRSREHQGPAERDQVARRAREDPDEHPLPRHGPRRRQLEPRPSTRCCRGSRTTRPACSRPTSPTRTADVSSTLLDYLPHTGTIGGMTTFYFTFVYSQPYAPLIPSGGLEEDPYFPESQPDCNQALFAYRTAIAAFVEEYLIAWNKALEEIRGTRRVPRRSTPRTKPGSGPAASRSNSGAPRGNLARLDRLGVVAGDHVAVQLAQLRLLVRAARRLHERAARVEAAARPAGSPGSAGRRASRIARRVALDDGSGIGTAESSVIVYGCSGFSYRSSAGEISTILPRYMTAIRSEMCRTTARSCAMKRYVRLKSRCSSSSRLTICAWIETSSAETGSSQTMKSGLSGERAREADALPLAARELVRVAVRRVGGQPDDAEQLAHLRRRPRAATRGRACAAARRRSGRREWRGLSDAYGSWKTICIRRRSGRSSLSPTRA